ncbi:MAG: DUF2508 family protein [Symbiobacteriia bacterium]
MVRETLLKALSTLPQRLVADEPAAVPAAQPLSFFELVEQARQDWVAARSYFETVSEPELVDHAIYLIEAAETRYMYLLHKARNQELRLGATH